METGKRHKILDHHNLAPGLIAEDCSSFTTKSFLIRYCEEEVELNDLVLFRAEIDAQDEYLDREFFLDFELYFSDLSNLGGPDNWMQASSRMEEAQFKLMQKQTYLIKSLARSMIEFCPVQFQGNCYSILAIQVQSVLIDYKFR
jgi:hypothetical protein